jgi:outer membrane protein assembly factor BamB
MAPLTAPVTSAMRTFGALLPSMLDLPSSPIETTNIAMGFKSTTNSLAEDGVVAWFAPYEDVAIIDNIEVRDVPLRAQPGQPFAFKLVIRDAYARTHPGAVELLRKHTRIYAYINETRTKLAFACTPLLPSVSATDDVKGVTVCISIPPGTNSQHVLVSGIRVAGTVLSFSPFPQTFNVLPGMDAPLDIYLIASKARDLVIASNAVMYVLCDNAMPVVRVFAADGSERPRLTVPTALKLSNLVFVDTLNMLLFTAHKTLIAFDVEKQTIRWQTEIATEIGISCCKPSVLSTWGICVITTDNKEVYVYSLDDGTLRFKDRTTEMCFQHTCDSATSTWYAQMPGVIVSFRWDGTELVADRTKQILTDKITVMPPTAGRHTSHLVSTHHKRTGFSVNVQLYVYALPDLRLVWSRCLFNNVIKTLVTDPSGTSIAILDCYGGDSIRVLPWPLAGMPALE